MLPLYICVFAKLERLEALSEFDRHKRQLSNVKMSTWAREILPLFVMFPFYRPKWFISHETDLLLAALILLQYKSRVPKSLLWSLSWSFFLVLHQQFLTAWVWGSAGKSVVEKLCECQQGGVLCSFVMRCWDKDSINHVSLCQSPAGSADPCWPVTVITHSVLLADRSNIDWWLGIVRFSFGLLFLPAVKAVMVLWCFDLCFLAPLIL